MMAIVLTGPRWSELPARAGPLHPLPRPRPPPGVPRLPCRVRPGGDPLHHRTLDLRILPRKDW